MISQFLLWMNEVIFLAGKERLNTILNSIKKYSGNLLFYQYKLLLI